MRATGCLALPLPGYNHSMTEPVTWIYLSPHLDDAALSCGGLIFDQVQHGERVAVWNLFAGQPDPALPISPFAQELHTRWGAGSEAVEARRAEDRAALALLGAQPRYFDWPDCIYRWQNGSPLISAEEDLWTVLPEPDLVQALSRLLRESLPTGARLVAPMSLGDHVDHRAARAAAEAVGVPVLYYADYPYIVEDAFVLNAWEQAGRAGRSAGSISPDGLRAWQDAVLAYTSQLSSFWSSEPEMRLCLSNYWAGGGGRLWELAGWPVALV